MTTESLIYKLIEYIAWHAPSVIFCGTAVAFLAARTARERRKRLSRATLIQQE